ncbi:uncharacterized protein PSFLO_00666 [Pseudozyma flocculosa]|uniref:Uncharacterized protein n=1 Tax=Pseudozyma flocculosa TaxID=84751 RepID=A0A5C3EU48_9BASI|nr:uncharacterized protein PSFLO_00666 [Pseudozyma flocculosa]
MAPYMLDGRQPPRASPHRGPYFWTPRHRVDVVDARHTVAQPSHAWPCENYVPAPATLPYATGRSEPLRSGTSDATHQAGHAQGQWPLRENARALPSRQSYTPSSVYPA